MEEKKNAKRIAYSGGGLVSSIASYLASGLGMSSTPIFVDSEMSTLRSPAAPESNKITQTVPIGPRSAKLRAADHSRKVAQGQKEFWYGDKSVWARNQFNADRKAVNAKYIKSIDERIKDIQAQGEDL